MSFEPSKRKSDAVKRLGLVLGEEFSLYEGSSVPKELFSAATRRAGVADDGSMPDKAERVARAAGLEWDSSCDSRSTPSGGGATVTLAGLNRLLAALESLGVLGTEALPGPEPDEGLGVPFKPRFGGITAEPTVLTQDWDALDESLSRHRDLERALADYVEKAGISPKSPRTSEPQYDLAWEHDSTTIVVEVKSLTEANRRQQVRLGVGQVLEYVAILQDNAPGDYRAVLLIGSEPDALDYLLAASSGVLIIDEGHFPELALENLLP